MQERNKKGQFKKKKHESIKEDLSGRPPAKKADAKPAKPQQKKGA